MIFFCSGIINLLFIFPRPCGARKNTTQLAKYPHVLYAKPSNKVYVSPGGDRSHKLNYHDYYYYGC